MNTLLDLLGALLYLLLYPLLFLANFIVELMVAGNHFLIAARKYSRSFSRQVLSVYYFAKNSFDVRKLFRWKTSHH